MGETAYAPCGEISLAYQVFGEGPIDLVVAGSFVSHVELIWTIPEAKAWFDRLGSFCRVLLFDKAGVGLSDPVPKVRSIEERATEIGAVMDAAGFDRAVLMGVSEGGPASIMFAATWPERVQALVLVGTYAWAGYAGWDDLERSPEEIYARLCADIGDAYAPTPGQVAVVQSMGRAARSRWGSGETLQALLPSVRSLRRLGTLERMSASPGMARATVESIFRIDVRSVLSTIGAPTLVVHATGDPIPVQGGRYLADHIPGARLIEFAGRDHAPWLSDPDLIVANIEEFLTGSRATSSPLHRALRTVLFSDIVASTARAASMGDERWRALLEQLSEIMAGLADRFGGTVVKSTGDGHLATFAGPTQAIRCAESLRDEAESLNVEVRTGIHTGECELMGDDIGGMAVHIAARVMAAAAAGEILVSSAVRDLVVGSGIGFEERGSGELRGVPGQWQLLAVQSKGTSADAVLAALATPSARSAMRRSDRAVATMVRRAPWLVRGLARVAPGGVRPSP